MIEKTIRTFLLKTLGLEAYLSIVSDVYLRATNAGLLKAKYPELFYLKKMVKEGWVCIDIGANVGYYSTNISRLCGKTGKVFAIEPVPLFANVFKRNAHKFALPNIQLHQVALGAENKKITMGTPIIDGVFRHGLTHVLAEKENGTGLETFEAEMKIPDELFASITKLDFIKCDVEGYEVYLFPDLMNTIAKFKPLIQIEISNGENRKAILDLLNPLNYKPYGLKNDQLTLLTENECISYEQGDLYFKA
ncbi:MAG: FkbM family methyltransferase [Bacteroidota bacterium]